MPSDPEVLSPDKWPITVGEAVTDILSRMTDHDKHGIRTLSKADLVRYHMGWGASIRNYYGMWTGNQKLIWDACGRAGDPDSASSIIIEAVWDELQRYPTV